MNLPNQLTMARLVFTVLFVVALSVHWHFACTLALTLFVLASITDYVDGEIARRWKLETNFGRLMDPLADKVMMAAALICLAGDAGDRVIPSWVAIVIIGREFLITGLRMLAASRGVVLPAEKLGKHKMVWQIVAVIFFLVMLSVREIGEAGATIAATLLRLPWIQTGWVLLTIAIGLTVYSGVGYVWKHRAYISEM